MDAVYKNYQSCIWDIDRIKKLPGIGDLTKEAINCALSAEQDGDAAIYVVLNRNRFAYDHAVGRWYVFEGHHWQEDTTGCALDAVKTTIKIYAQAAQDYARTAIREEETGESKSAKIQRESSDCLQKRIKKLHTVYRKESVLKLAASGEKGLGIRGEEWDQIPMMFPCANGLIDLETGQLTDGRPDQYIRTVSPINYDLNAPEPKIFKRFLDDVFAGNPALIDYMQRLLGYCLIGKVTEHIFPILWGRGRNGKGTLLQIISHVLGPIAGPVKASLLLDHGKFRSSASPNPDILDLRGKRMVWASETNEGAIINAGVVKWLVGGDILVGRAVYGKHEVRFEPSHTLFLITNHKPHAPAGRDDFAFWQRIHLIPFNLSFTENPQGEGQRKIDKDLPEKLKSEAEGILTWLIKGCLIYQQKGLNPPKEITAATKKYADDEDVITRFIDECCLIDTNCSVKAQELHNAFKVWSEDSGYRAMSKKYFGKKISRVFEKKVSNGIKYLGLKLRED